MPKPNDDLFKRLRRAGVRKPVAKTLSELTEDAGKKAAGAGHKAFSELRALVDEVEKRLPASASRPRMTPDPPSPKAASSTPRGENKAKILAALEKGPRTASDISQETGIATTTVSSALNRLTKTGEVSKASRGYALPT